jgi:hypothetical protein
MCRNIKHLQIGSRIVSAVSVDMIDMLIQA